MIPAARMSLTPTIDEVAETLTGSVQSPRVEAERLVQHVAERSSRAELFASDQVLTGWQSNHLRVLVERRVSGEPLQYIIGTQQFRNLELEVGPGVLVPRPETEVVVEQALQCLRGIERPRVADVGTGAGPIALAIAIQRPDAEVWGTDSSTAALAWARRNARKLGISNVQFLHGDLLTWRGDNPIPGRRGDTPTPVLWESEEPKAPGVAQYRSRASAEGARRVSPGFWRGDTPTPVLWVSEEPKAPGVAQYCSRASAEGARRVSPGLDLVVSNPPYLTPKELFQAPIDVRDHEPREALVSGPTGLEVTERLVTDAPMWLKPGGWLVLEITPLRAKKVAEMLAARFADVEVFNDLAGRARVAVGRRR